MLLSIVRLMLPRVLLPATTALGTIDPIGREQGVLAGANVVMPNLSPLNVRKKYMLYDNKISTGAEAASNIAELRQRMEAIGYEVAVGRGDYPGSKVIPSAPSTSPLLSLQMHKIVRMKQSTAIAIHTPTTPICRGRVAR